MINDTEISRVHFSYSILRALGAGLGLLLFIFLSSAAAQTQCSDTMLMFVGQELEVLSIASRREQSAGQAPAVADVITREMISDSGVSTLAQALDMTPGFFMAQKEWGTQPYLRGIPDSVLFLYDTVPMLSDTTKSVHPLDEELSLAAVKRIEIIRGPGSVLWGADAFAGIVNVVPLTGKDLSGVETGIWAGGPDSPRGFHLNAGHDGGAWDGFLSVSGKEMRPDTRTADLLRFWGNHGDFPVAPEDRYGSKDPDRPQYLEIAANASISDKISISGRFSDYSRPYTVSDQDRERVWAESRSAPVSFLKLEGRQDIDPDSAFRYTAYYSSIESRYRVIDTSFSPEERTFYGEVLYDHDFMTGKGLLTTGVSFRRKQIKNAPIWDSYLPDYLGPDNESFLPGISEKDYNTELWSFFGQYTHKIGPMDFCLGLRHDRHDTYRDRLSYYTGLVWSPACDWTLKTVYGTAYRTPFARQLIEEDKPDLEKVTTLNVQAAWSPTDKTEFLVGGFVNKIKDHIMEDPYAGLSEPNKQTIKGIEFSGRIRPFKSLELGANLTLTDNHGPDETYWYNDYSSIRPDGTIEKHFTDLRYPFDTGPQSLMNATAAWIPVNNLILFAKVRYFGDQELIYPRNENRVDLSGQWLIDMGCTFRDIGTKGTDLSVACRNLFDKNYYVPGTYSAIEGDPFEIEVRITRKW
jgi:outer membrane cobalamin receptor